MGYRIADTLMQSFAFINVEHLALFSIFAFWFYARQLRGNHATRIFFAGIVGWEEARHAESWAENSVLVG